MGFYVINIRALWFHKLQGGFVTVYTIQDRMIGVYSLQETPMFTDEHFDRHMVYVRALHSPDNEWRQTIIDLYTNALGCHKDASNIPRFFVSLLYKLRRVASPYTAAERSGALAGAGWMYMGLSHWEIAQT